MQMVIETTVNDGEPVTEALSFSYDASGMPMAVIYNGTAYFYTVNLQGDVVGIMNMSGELMVGYTYDAWGNVLSVTGPMASTMGYWNQYRYRGYVYDQETDLYYLQSRYYDPEVGRFINADAFASTGQGVLGNNMFAYCGNNPANRVDLTGHAFMQMRFDPDGALNMLAPILLGGGSGGFSSENTVRSSGSRANKSLTHTDPLDARASLQKNGFTFYRGCLVTIADLPDEGAALSYGLIVLDEYYKYVPGDEFVEVLNHEYGHFVHFGQIGLGAYTVTTAIPSLICAGLSNVSPWIRENYYSLPTERTADFLGGVYRGDYLPSADSMAFMFWLFTQAVSSVMEVWP